MTAQLTLKWGTLKGWDFTDNEVGLKLLREYNELGASMSAMAQHDVPRQKEIICALIDICEDGTVYNDWDGEHMTNDAAKAYVMNYGLSRTAPTEGSV